MYSHLSFLLMGTHLPLPYLTAREKDRGIRFSFWRIQFSGLVSLTFKIKIHSIDLLTKNLVKKMRNEQPKWFQISITTLTSNATSLASQHPKVSTKKGWWLLGLLFPFRFSTWKGKICQQILQRSKFFFKNMVNQPLFQLFLLNLSSGLPFWVKKGPILLFVKV